MMPHRRHILLKTREEIEKLGRANHLNSRTIAEVGKHIRPGVSTAELDKVAYDFITAHGGYPSCLGFEGYPASICASVNEVVVHGIPHDDVILREGDVITIDLCTELEGFVGDSAFTFAVGEIDPKVADLLTTTKEALELGIREVEVGKHIGDIGAVVQKHCEAKYFGVVREFVGHGIGRSMHEDPNVPNYGHRGTGPAIEEGLCICIEPMITLGSKNIVISDDGWTVRTKDRKPAAHYEHCVAVVDGRAKLLSSFDYIYDAIGRDTF